MNNNVIPLTQRLRKEKRADRRKSTTLCSSGFHKWVACKDKPFDVKQGKLISAYRCQRCGAEKISAQ